jgi:hypothetical protein
MSITAAKALAALAPVQSSSGFSGEISELRLGLHRRGLVVLIHLRVNLNYAVLLEQRALSDWEHDHAHVRIVTFF